MAEKKQEFLNDDQVVETWGKEFVPLLGKKGIKFTATEIIMPLSSPLQTVDGPIEALSIHEPSVSELKFGDGVEGEVSKTLMVLRVVCGIPQEVLAKMKARDFMRVNAVMNVFFGATL